MTKKEPYLSLVVASRNDNHGGDMLKRMLIFINGLNHLSKKYQLPIEVIFVEWNPPTDAPLLKDILPNTAENEYMELRFILVPKEIHERYNHAYMMPLFQMTAKNVGIRRAKGEFVCATNVDLLFSEELFIELAKRNLTPDAFYRANRCDIPREIDENWSFDQQIDFAKKNTTERLGKHYAYFSLIDMPGWIYFFPFFARFLNRLISWRRGVKYPAINKMLELDSFACGDFTLMHKKAWEDIQGYLELDLYSIHIDTIGIAAAMALGYKQIIFKPECCTYHIHHESGWGSGMTAMDLLRFYNKRPGLGYHTSQEVVRYLLENSCRADFNPTDWGFMNENFEEYRT